MTAPVVHEPAPIAEDKLEGAQAIADFLRWPRRKVFRAREENWPIPIRYAPGFGVYAFRSELTAYLRGAETLAVQKVA